MKKQTLLLTMVLAFGNYAWAQFNTTTAGNISSYGAPEAVEQNDSIVAASENDSIEAAIVDNLLPDTVVTTVVDSISVQSDTIVNPETNDTTILTTQRTITEENGSNAGQKGQKREGGKAKIRHQMQSLVDCRPCRCCVSRWRSTSELQRYVAA